MRLRTDSQPWYKEPWPWILMAGPAVVVVAGVVTAWLAIRSNDGLVVDDYYKQGLAVNQQMHRDQAAVDLGIHADLMRSGLQLRLALQGREQVKYPETLSLRVFHPTRAGFDQTITLVAEAPGFYGGKLTNEISGRWHVTLEEPAGSWRLQGDWQADAMEPLRLGAGDGVATTHQSVTGR